MLIRNYLFHRVAPSNEQWSIPMNLKKFEKCIKYISSNFVVKTIEEVASDLMAHKENKIASISFDDGFKDNIQYAAPILDKYKIKASFYVTTDCIDYNTPTWTHLYFHSFIETSKNVLILNSESLNFNNKKIVLNSSKEKIDFAHHLFIQLKNIPFEEINDVMSQIKLQFNDITPLENYMMNWNDIRGLSNYGHQIGSHTKSHPFLASIKDKVRLENELKFSMDRIISECNIVPKTISYPVGNYNDDVKNTAKNIGYKLGLAVNQNFYDTERIDQMEIPRIDVYSDQSWIKTYLNLTNSTSRIKQFLRL